MPNLPNQANFDLDAYPLYNLNRTSATYIDEMSKALQHIGMTQNQWRILGILGHKNPSTVSEMSRKGVIKMSTLTRILDKMESQNLVTRTPWAQDKRIIKVEITESGREQLNKAIRVNTNVYNRVFSGVSVQQIKQLMATLKTMRENLTRAPYGD